MKKDLFETIDTTIRKERLYVKNLMREDVMKRFGISRHYLNDLLNLYADGKSFPQYINAIRMEKIQELMTSHPGIKLNNIAREVGFTIPNMRIQFKQKYGMTPIKYKRKH